MGIIYNEEKQEWVNDFVKSPELNIAQIKNKCVYTITKVNNDILYFFCTDGFVFKMYHDQQCCEGVEIEDICGDLQNLIGEEILIAEESSNSDNPKDHDDNFIWTFYKLATIKGYVDIRWYGSSNGYYSEEVYFKEINKDDIRIGAGQKVTIYNYDGITEIGG